MKLERCHPDRDGEMFWDDEGEYCCADDVEKLEESHQRLLDALKEIIEQTDGRNNSVMGQDRAYSIARAAIAKAKGEQL